MKPEKRKYTGERKFEQVKTNEFIPGVIEDIQRDKERVTMFEGKESIKDQVRFKFKLEGYQFPHYSKWETFSYGSKSNLYKKYLVPLVSNAKPDMDFDLENLKGKSIKTFWTQSGHFQNLQLIVSNEPGACAPVVAAVEESEEEAPI